MAQSVGNGTLEDAVITEGADGGDRGARIIDLEAPRKDGQRQIEETGFVLVDEAAVLLEGLPVGCGDERRRGPPARLGDDRVEGLVGLGGDDAGYALLEDAGLLGGDGGKGRAEKLLMIVIHRGDDGDPRF